MPFERAPTPGDPPADPEVLWAGLADPDAEVGVRAVGTLTEVSGAVPLLAGRLPLRAVDPDRTRRLIADPGSPDFRTREAASRDLGRLGPLAAPDIREAARSGSPEVARRADLLLRGAAARFPLRGETLRAARAVHVLERIGTPEARAVLDRWATDRRDPFLAGEARRSLDRIGRPPPTG